VIDRRDILIGGGCALAAGAAWAMVPRRRVSLLGARSLDAILPRAFGAWTSRDTSDLVAPTEPDSLAARLYESTVARVYQQKSTGQEVMALFAHGDTQSDDLQVHRPEICYPAFGFAISDSRAQVIAVASAVDIPARSLVADGAGRRETVLYWTRLGEFLPRDRKEQQLDRMRTALKGELADGILVRFSVGGPDAAASIALMQAFAPALVKAMAPADRQVLIGAGRAAELQRALTT
jgi:EpsI family protein